MRFILKKAFIKAFRVNSPKGFIYINTLYKGDEIMREQLRLCEERLMKEFNASKGLSMKKIWLAIELSSVRSLMN